MSKKTKFLRKMLKLEQARISLLRTLINKQGAMINSLRQQLNEQTTLSQNADVDREAHG